MKPREWLVNTGGINFNGKNRVSLAVLLDAPYNISGDECIRVIEAAPVLAEIEALKKELACLYSVLSEDKMSEWKECYTQWFAALELKDKRK